MTYGSSIESWAKAGILERELELYHEHANNGFDIHIVSYGNVFDLKLLKKSNFVTVHYNKWNLHPRLYAWLLPFLHHKILREADLYKTNQLYGAHVARRCSFIWRKPHIVRQGYGHYEHRVEEFGKKSLKAYYAKKYEKKSLKASSAIVFTTYELAKRASERHKLPKDKIYVIPNYIVPEVWTPAYRCKEIGEYIRLVFYGRFTKQKNLDNLIKSLVGLPAKLILIGSGPLQEKIENQTRKLAIDCVFYDRIEQKKLHSVLQQADVFVLPSLYEGHPKSLLEAMAFGMPVLAADSPGIREQIIQGDTGILVPCQSDGLRKGVKILFEMSKNKRKKLGESARKWSLDNFSVNTIARKERELFLKVIV